MAQPFKLSPLPYAEDALDPTISARTVGIHYNKHHKAYVETLNKLVMDTKFAGMNLEEIVQATAGRDDATEMKLFDNAGQVWNHDFYWRSMTPKQSKPSGKLAQAISHEFGDVDTLIAKLAEAGKAQFGSGWVWLTSRDGKLAIEKTGDASSPMANGINCLITLDVWEHAYYLDYQNERAHYLENALAKLINWKFAEENLARESHPVRAAAE